MSKPIVKKSGSVWMMTNKPCQSCAREIAESAMKELGLDYTGFRIRDRVVMAISDKLGEMMDAAKKSGKP